MLKRALAVVGINVVVFCVLAELATLAVFYFQHGWLFYIDPYRPTYELIPETQNRRLTSEGLHPYFGPTHRSGIPFDIPESLRRQQDTRPRVATNNFGFTSAYNYPFVKNRDDQFIVGIFGGSVGVWFCELGATRLIENLKRNSFFKNRDVITLCLSHEGYKQPQQLLLLAYFLSLGQPFDLVINIDGFNEVALSSLNDQRGWDISMPSAVHLEPLVNLINQATLTPDKLSSLATISRYKQQLNTLAERINQSRLASVHFVWEKWYAIVNEKYQMELATFDALPSNPSDNSLVYVTPKIREREGTALFEDIARNWISASMLMRDLLAARSVAYFHFLQPNQYYTRRMFSDGEAKVALSDESPYKASVKKGYPVLVKELESTTLTKRPLTAFDATRIFDAEPSPVYVDNCCHYTRVGNDLLADFIAMSVLSSPGVWR